MPIRVLLVDDAVVVRHILRDTLSKDPDFTIVGAATDGADALDKIPTTNPDVIVLDVEMPEMDGIETLAIIRKRWPQIKVIMFSTLTSRGAAATMDALLLGAHDYVTKPANVGSMTAAVEEINNELAPRIKALAKRISTVRPTKTLDRPQQDPTIQQQAGSKSSSAPLETARIRTNKIACVAVAVSTGGPNALAEFLPKLPKNLSAPIVIVQHIPPMFSKALADRLDAKSELNVREGIHGANLAAGDAWLAPGDYHMTVRRGLNGTSIELNQGPSENSCRPAADVLFRSAVAAFGSSVLGVVLTGMGNDGLKGSRTITEAGGKVLVQDETTSVVWGMPGAVAQAGLADSVLPLDLIANEVINRVGTSSRPITPSRLVENRRS